MDYREAYRYLRDVKGLQCEDLDELVHEAASKIASSVNNSGMKEQVEFLFEQGYTLEEIENG